MTLGAAAESLRQVNGRALDPNRPLAVHCKSGYRSSIASSLFRRAGFRQVLNVTGGFDAWMAQKLPVETPERAAILNFFLLFFPFEGFPRRRSAQASQMVFGEGFPQSLQTCLPVCVMASFRPARHFSRAAGFRGETKWQRSSSTWPRPNNIFFAQFDGMFDRSGVELAAQLVNQLEPVHTMGGSAARSPETTTSRDSSFCRSSGE